MVQSVIEFLIRNNISIIQAGFAILFFLAVFVIARSFKEESAQVAKASSISERARAREEEKRDVPPPAPAAAMSDDKSPLDDLDNLDELMGPPGSETPAAAEAPAGKPVEPTAAVSAAPAVDPTAAAAAVVAATAEKEKVIEGLKAEIAQLQDKSKSQGDTLALQEKIKELSDKLSEYEIIEDDIANLSFYKSENTKLKNELEKLRGLPSELPAPPAAAEAPAREPAPKLEPAVIPAVAEPVPPPPAPPAAPAPADNTILEEFEKAVQQKEALEMTTPEPVAEKISAPKDQDLMKEFESLMDQDMEKNAGSENEVPAAAPAPTPAPVAEPAAEVATPKIDAQKLMAEVESMADVPAPAAATADDGKDSTQKLIEEFENFMNKASS